jgi:predicted small secreted protein
MKKSKFLLVAALLVVFALEGCSTARGIGEDIQSLGRAIKRVFSE